MASPRVSSFPEVCDANTTISKSISAEPNNRFKLQFKTTISISNDGSTYNMEGRAFDSR